MQARTLPVVLPGRAISPADDPGGDGMAPVSLLEAGVAEQGSELMAVLQIVQAHPVASNVQKLVLR